MVETLTLHFVYICKRILKLARQTMVPFLKLVAQDLYSKYENGMQNICIVFPNRRSILYFNKYLSQIVQKPAWAPQCTTVSAFVQSFSGLQKADDLLLLFDLYKVYNQVRNISEPFDSFYYWGELMLSDFDDIDKFLVNAEVLFQNLSALKNINEQFSYLNDGQVEAIKLFWKNFESSRNSEQRKDFSDMWSSMFAIYKRFKDVLNEKKLAYEGIIYREVADSIQSGAFTNPSFDKIVFAGFNALSECEKTIFRNFKNNGMALFYWDYDTDYISQPHHEAGFFIKNNLKEFPSALENSYFNNLQSPGKLELIAVPSQTGQAKIAGQLLSRFHTCENNFENTAILLPDETLLMPILHSLPAEILDVNITMGFPVKNSPIIDLISSIGTLYGKTNSSNENQARTFYYKQVLKVLSHPYIKAAIPDEINKFELKVINQNIINVGPSSVPESELTKIIFQYPSDGNAFVNNLTKIIKIIGQHSFNNKPELYEQPEGIESETLIAVYKATNRFADLISKGDLVLNIQTCASLLLKILNGLTVPFEGEPLKGLQIMGFLESRALDFENVIILNVNEGNLPKTNLPVSFIPYNLRHGFNLPTLEYRDAMYAYYFYRVIQRAKNIYLIYNTKADKTGSSEMSRYATQILYNKKFKVVQKVQIFNIIPSKLPDIRFEKTPEVISILSKYLEFPDNKHYLSPSALASYIDCSLRFYFHYVAGIKEFETPVDEIDAPLLGNILHRAMQILYTPFVEKILQKEDLETLLKNNQTIEAAIYKAMEKEYFKSSVINESGLIGRNFIIFKILNKYVRKIIETDCQTTPFTILALEHNIVNAFEITVPEGNLKIKVGGNIDRVDKDKNGIRIIDYKTGKVEQKFSGFEELFSPEEGKKLKKEILQALLYSLLYKVTLQPEASITPGLFSLRNIFGDAFDPNIYIGKSPISDIKLVENDFNTNLKQLLTEIYNPNIAFERTKDLKRCENCTYKIICHR
jgi:hypothetical protein